MIITIAAQKGGAGKTTTAAALSQAIRHAKKRSKVLLVDTDGQASASMIYGADDMPGPTLYDVIKGTCKASEAIRHTEAGDILPATVELYGLDVELQKRPGRDFILSQALKEIQDDYTHIIIDTAPGVGTMLIQSLTAADAVIIPTECDAQAFHGVGDILETIQQVRSYCNEGLKISGVLLIRYNSRSVISRQFEEILTDLAKDYDTKVLRTRIRQGVSIKEAQALRRSLYDYAPKSNPAADYMALIKELKL